LIENKLGLMPTGRLPYNELPYYAHFPKDQQEALRTSENQRSLFDCVQAWLERTPFLQIEGFDFWQRYRQAVGEMFDREQALIAQNPLLNKSDLERNMKILNASRVTFEALFDKPQYDILLQQGRWRLSYRAVHAALLIQLYRDQPVLQLPFRLITTLIKLDEMLANWRYRHALLASRMLGTKVGTGGSSGAQYLKQSTEHHRIFSDFFQLTTFFIPRSALPELPQKAQKKLGFHYNSSSEPTL
jgi:tryptophan 2,3-dioxygenase